MSDRPPRASESIDTPSHVPHRTLREVRRARQRRRWQHVLDRLLAAGETSTPLARTEPGTPKSRAG